MAIQAGNQLPKGLNITTASAGTAATKFLSQDAINSDAGLQQVAAGENKRIAMNAALQVGQAFQNFTSGAKIADGVAPGKKGGTLEV